VISITSVACLAGRRREALILSTRHPAIVNQSIGRLATRSESHGHSRPSGQDAAHPLLQARAALRRARLHFARGQAPRARRILQG
jgi:hypothetical protein